MHLDEMRIAVDVVQLLKICLNLLEVTDRVVEGMFDVVQVDQTILQLTLQNTSSISP